MAALRRADGVFDVTDPARRPGKVHAGVFQCLRIGDNHLGPLLEEPPGNEDRGTFPGVARVRLEGETPQADPFPGQGIEHGPQHVPDEALLLVVVDLHDALPVIRNLLESVIPAEVDEVEDILVEAGTAEADAGVEELGADPAVHADGACDLGDIRLSLFTEGGNSIDRGDPLGEEGIGNQLGELAAPDIGGDDLLPRDPVCVDLRQCLPCFQSALRFP